MEIAETLMEIITEDLSILDSGKAEYIEFSDLSLEVAEEVRKRFILEYGDDKYKVETKGVLFDKSYDREIRNIRAIMPKKSEEDDFDEYVIQIRRKS